MKNEAERRIDISLYGDILSVADICEYLGIGKADVQRIINDPNLKKLPIPIKRVLVSKTSFLEYLGLDPEKTI